MALRLYFDEHIDPRIARTLRVQGVDVLTAQEAGMADRGVPDQIQLSYAAVQGRTFVTSDWDFLRYFSQVRPHAGVVIVPRRVAIGTAALYLEVVATAGNSHDYENQLLVYPSVP